VNRDDTGSPKTAVYGGVQRARVSSQSWKKAIRDSFKENFSEHELGIRTKKIVDLVKDNILKIDTSKNEEEAKNLSVKIIEAAGVTTKDQEANAPLT
jgi:CRISPR system Cascade subunit CasC